MKSPDLQEYAMIYLARYNNTEKGLSRILKAKLRRWSVKAEQEGMESSEIESIFKNGLQQISEVIAQVKKLGIINDQSFAEYKVHSLIRSGRSQKMIQNTLLQKGVDLKLIQSVLDTYHDKDVELLAALIYARKRRIGPFRRIDREFNEELRQKEQMSFARNGFSFKVSSKILSMDQSEAEETIGMLRSL